MKKKYIELEMTPLERTVFLALLDSATDLTYEKIVEMLGEIPWNKRSVYTAINSLKKKGLIQESGKIKVACTRALLYRSTLTKGEYLELSHKKHFEKLNDGSVDFVLSALAGYNKETRNQDIIEDVELWIKQQIENIKNSH